MSHWIALIPQPLSSSSPTSPCTEAPLLAALDARSLGWWCLQFTPRVALLEEAVVAELQASHRLFGGPYKLVQRIQTESQALGCTGSAQAHTAMAALALARHHGHLACPPMASPSCDAGGVDAKAWVRSLQEGSEKQLQALPLNTLTAVAAHQGTLARLGCRSLGHVLALPRGGLSRRFGASLLLALDQAQGHKPQAFEWLTLPAVFDARLGLPGRVESAPALAHAAQILIQRLCAWLAGHHAGVHAWTLRWQHDFHRRDVGSQGEWTVRLGSPSRDPHRLNRLMTEHLQRIQLAAPVGEVSLHAHELSPLADEHRNLFPEISGDTLSMRADALSTPAAQQAQQNGLLALLERLSARLGAEQVQQGRRHADHRPERMQSWYPTPQGRPDRQPAALPPMDLPQPTWLLPSPQALSLIQDAKGMAEWPFYQGRLQLLAGPHRIEAGWWDDLPAARDYYLASSPRAGLLWVYRTRSHTQTGDLHHDQWFLHGLFA